MKKTLGGDRLGSGKKMTVDLHGYERSTHDLSYIWRSTMSAGTLVPFMSLLALPGDTFDIDLDCDLKTHPTLGPLFGSFKVQLDTFQSPIRLYQGELHNNKLGIGMNMSQIKLPIMRLHAQNFDWDNAETIPDINTLQINPSCILPYLGIRGIGIPYRSSNNTYRDFNAIPWLTYWDIYKNYYSNKQEEIGAVIHSPLGSRLTHVSTVVTSPGGAINQSTPGSLRALSTGSTIVITLSLATQNWDQVYIRTSTGQKIPINQIGDLIDVTGLVYTFSFNQAKWGNQIATYWDYFTIQEMPLNAPTVATFDLADIDTMRERILGATGVTSPFDATNQNLYPYDYLTTQSSQDFSRMYSQEGLGLKTYQSDLFNNWLSTEWIDGAGGISEVTAIDTSGGSFTIDTLNLSKKVYDMLNRIAVSGGTYDDWLDAVYAHDRYQRCESPMYMGGLIKELVFQEVVSNSQSSAGDATGQQPLGTLAGKGIMGKKHKGGKIIIKVDEPSYIMGIISITPRIDYCQGNSWDTWLMTMDDLHKPALDEIGFQELIIENFAWWNTTETNTDTHEWLQQSAGKQPAWINYMTNVNKVYGNFAIEDSEMFMVLNRRYTPEYAEPFVNVDDLTTYIHPEKFNFIFADTALDSQNYWAQIAVNIMARRKMSAKLMPNL